MFRYKEIAENLERKIKTEGIKHGERLTSVRKLCKEYNCHQSTALKALKYLVEKEMIYSISQSGFYVAGTDNNDIEASAIIDFKSTSPDQLLFPYKDYQKCINLAIEKHRTSLFEYSQVQGYAPLKNAVVKLVTNDYIFTDPKNIVITTGIQQGLSLLTEMDFNINRQKILIEQPTYHRYIEYLKLNSVKVVTIERRKDGLDLVELENLFRVGNIKFFYLMPRVHNVFGTCLTSEDKKRIVELAYKYDVYIVEDDYMGDYVINKNNDPLITYDENKTHVIYLRSFSKIIFPGLRVGFTILPTTLINKFEEKKFYSDLGTSLLVQASLSIYINNKMYERHLAKMRQIYSDRAKMMNDVLKSLGFEYSYSEVKETAIVQTCLQLQNHYSVKQLEKKGINVANINDFYFDDRMPKKNYMPLNVSNVETRKIKTGIDKLCDLLDFL